MELQMNISKHEKKPTKKKPKSKKKISFSEFPMSQEYEE